MSQVPFPKTFGTASHLSDGDCLDCGADASVYTLPVEGGQQPVVVHRGRACPGFAQRFTPGDANPHGPSPTAACDEQGTSYATPQEDIKPSKPKQIDRRTGPVGSGS